MSAAVQGRQGPSHSKNKADVEFKKYRTLVPVSLSDAELHALIKRCDNDDGKVQSEISSLWDREAEKTAEDSDWIEGKKSKKKAEAPLHSDRGNRRGDRDRGGRVGGRGDRDRAAGRGGGGRGSSGPPAAPARPQTHTNGSTNGALPQAPASDASEKISAPVSFSEADNKLVAATQTLAVSVVAPPPPASSAPVSSVWGGKLNLAQKIKTAEKAAEKAAVQQQAAAQAAEQAHTTPEKSGDKTAEAVASSGKKPRNRKDRKAGSGKSKGDTQVSAQSPGEQPLGQAEVTESAAAVPESSPAPLPPAPVPVEPSPVSAATVSQAPVREDLKFQQTKKDSHHREQPKDANGAFVTLGRWESSEANAEAGIKFGNFGGDSTSQNSPAGGSGHHNKSSKSPSKNSWKSHESKKTSSHNHSDVSVDGWGAAASAGNAAAGSSEISASANVESFPQPREDANSALHQPARQAESTQSSSPPGLSAGQGLETSKSSGNQSGGQQNGHHVQSRGNNSQQQSRKSDQDYHASGGRQGQSSAPPGMNARGGGAAVGASFGASGVSSGGVMPMPYAMPWDLSHQAPALHHASYSPVQSNYSAGAAAGATASPAAGAAAAGTPAQASGSSTTAAVTQPGAQPQSQYQAPPPGMPIPQQYLQPYSYNAYYGQPYYYGGGAPQGYYARGQPMYQPPRGMYGEAYGTGAPAIGGYTDMYGAQAGQFGDSSLYGGVPLHHQGHVPHIPAGNGTERGTKGQKNAVNTSGSAQQQTGSGVTQQESLHTHSGYPGYGSTYGARDQTQSWPQYPSWGAPMIYGQPSPTGALGVSNGGFSGRGGQHDSSSRSAGGSGGVGAGNIGYSGGAGGAAPYGGGRNNVGTSSAGGATQSAAPSSSTGSSANLQSTNW